MNTDGNRLPSLATNLGEFNEFSDHVVTNYKVSFRLSPPRVSTFEEIIRLFTDELSSKHYERHIFTCDKALKCYLNGFFMKDLSNIFQIVNECVKRLEEMPKFMCVLIEVARICRLPFLLEKTSDELKYRSNAVGCIEQLGYLLRFDNIQLQEQICISINHFYNPNDFREVVLCDENVKQATQEFNRKIVDESDFCDIISKFYPLVWNEESLKCNIYELLMSLSNCSESNCNKMLNHGIIPHLCRSMREALEAEDMRMILMVTEVLWNVVEYGVAAVVTQQLNDEKHLNGLKDIFVKFMTHSFNSDDRQLRNDILSIVCLIASRCSDLPLIKCDLVKMVVVFATFMEVRTQNILVKHLKLDPGEEADFELKKMLFDAIVTFLKVPGSIQIYSECRMIQALIRYLHCGQTSEKINSGGDALESDAPLPTSIHPQSIWFPKQYDEIQLFALLTLSKVAPLMIGDIIDCKVLGRLLNMLNSCTRPNKSTQEITSSHPSDITPVICNKHLLKECVAITHNLIATRNDEIIKQCIELKVLNVLLDLMGILATRCDSTDNLVVTDRCLVHVQIDLLTIISILCEECNEERGEFNERDVDTLLKYLDVDVDVVSPDIDRYNLLMSSIHSIWTCLIGVKSSEDYFVENNGIHALLNILQRCPYNLKSLILGCLCDLLGNEGSIERFNCWLGKVAFENYFNSLVSLEDGTRTIRKEFVCLGEACPKLEQRCLDGHINAPQLLCQLWRDDEARMEILRDESGIIIDLEEPLQSKKHQNKTLIVQPADKPSASVVEIFGNLRSKIYLIFNQIGFKNLPGISGRDCITLALIENYLDLKEAEVIKEMIEEMAEEEFTPIDPDGESIQVLLSTIDAKHNKVKETQQEIKYCLDRVELSEEQIYYAKIKQTKKQEFLKDEFSEYCSKESKINDNKTKTKAKRCGTGDLKSDKKTCTWKPKCKRKMTRDRNF